MMGRGPPARIETDRLVLRCWRPADTLHLREAIDLSLEHLRPWMPWALNEPSSLDDTRARLTRYESSFREGRDFVYGIFSQDESEVLGSSGLHPRVGADALEIGYWIRADRIGKGFATEAVQALTDAGLSVPGVHRIEIHCDPRNSVSAAIPRRLGFTLRETLRGNKTDSEGRPRDTWIFELSRRVGHGTHAAGEPHNV